MKKIVILLLFVLPLCGFGQEIITGEEHYFDMLREHIGLKIRNVIFPGIDSVACDSIQHGEGKIKIWISVDQDSSGKFHVENFRAFGDCPKKKQYIEDKRNEIIRKIENMQPIMIFVHDGDSYVWKKGLTKKELFERKSYLSYRFPFFIQVSECGDEFIIVVR